MRSWRPDLSPSLPGGRRGRALALALTLALAGLLWAGGGAPLARWYAARETAIADRAALAAHLQSLASALPSLRAAAAVPSRSVLLAGESDAISAAHLQEKVGAIAGGVGLVPASLETLPAAPLGALRRIGLRVTLAGPWPRLVALLGAIAQAEPRMLLDEMTLRGLPARGPSDDTTVAASFIVFAFRADGA